MEKWLVICVALVIAGAWGCDGDDETANVDSAVQSEDWPDEPRRVVSMAPTVTEVLFELGLGDRVVAVTRYCDWPQQVEELPTIGGMLDPDYEAILAANPDVVVGVKDGADHQVVERLQGAGVAYGFVAMDDLDTIRRGITELGGWMERQEEAEELVEKFDREVEEASRRLLEGRERKTRALMVFDREPLVVAGPGSYGDEVLKLAGLENAVDKSLRAYPVLDVEKLLGIDPELVIDVTVGVDEEGGMAYWDRFDTMRAVKEGQVIHVDNTVMMRPGVRIPQALDELARALESP